MKSIFIVTTVLCMVVAGIGIAGTVDNPAASTSKGAEWGYPIAPGVWYPGDGPIPEKPMRYYRIRCWPGCHSGSKLGKYPDKPLIGKPIHQTSALKAHP